MKRLLLIATFFLLNGCTLNQLFLSDEIDKVNVVQYHPYVKEHRAYFTRTDLKPVWQGEKYLLLYHPKQKDLFVLLHKGKYYFLYNFTKPQRKAKKFLVRSGHSVRTLLRTLNKAGYRHIEDPTEIGFTLHTGLRRYKQVKTLMIDIKDYRPLKKRYEEAIRTYDAAKVAHIKTHLPKRMIAAFFTKYFNKAQTSGQKAQLRKIAAKLNLSVIEEKNEPAQIEPLFPYYLHHATIKELQDYLSKPQTKSALEPGQYSLLEHRLATMEKQQLLEEGSLEALIAEYKKNHDPEFKKHILERIKQLQEN